MNLKTSFFNVTIFKKDLTRFWPLWAIYFIVGLFLCISNNTDLYYQNALTYTQFLTTAIPAMCVYALLTAQLLFGDLFQGRLGYAVHALPVRREGLFFTHFTAGMLMGLVPNLIIALIAMPGMENLWMVAPLWYVIVSLSYFLFFCMAIFCMHCAGNRIGALAMYALINCLGPMVMVCVENFYLSMLYGVELTDKTELIFIQFSPVLYSATNLDWLKIIHSENCPVQVHTEIAPNYGCLYEFQGIGKSWNYLICLAAVCILFGLAAFFIYRRRPMESAGDFISFKPMNLVFTVAGSVAAGYLIYLITGEAYWGLFVGLILGFIACRMLLERSIKVFSKKNHIGLGILLGVAALTLLLTYFDAFGIVTRVPETDKIESVSIADGHVSDLWLELDVPTGEELVQAGDQLTGSFGKSFGYTFAGEKDMENIRKIHQLLIAEGDARDEVNHYETITIFYRLKNGTTITRYYYTAGDSQAMQNLKGLTNSPRFILGFDTPEEMLECLNCISPSLALPGPANKRIRNAQWLERFVNALYEDARAGNMVNKGRIYMSLFMEYEGDTVSDQYNLLQIPYEATNTLNCMQEYLVWLHNKYPFG